MANLPLSPQGRLTCRQLAHLQQQSVSHENFVQNILNVTGTSLTQAEIIAQVWEQYVLNAIRQALLN